MLGLRSAWVILPATLALGACAGPAALPQGPSLRAAAFAPALAEAVGLSLGANTDNQAALRFEAPKAAYALLDAPVATVHRWVPGDIVQYEVAFKKQVGADQFETTGFAEVVVPIKGANPKTTAVFSKVPWGSLYRAFVTAKGNVNGDPTGTLVVLNDVAATADFDFTTTQDAPSAITKSVQVVFNQVAFSGTGSVTFQQPAEGTYANPVGEIQATATGTIH